MRIILRMKTIARRLRNNYYSLDYHAKGNKWKKLLNLLNRFYINLYQAISGKIGV